MSECIVALNNSALLVPSFEIAAPFNTCVKRLSLSDWRELFCIFYCQVFRNQYLFFGFHGY